MKYDRKKYNMDYRKKRYRTDGLELVDLVRDYAVTVAGLKMDALEGFGPFSDKLEAKAKLEDLLNQRGLGCLIQPLTEEAEAFAVEDNRCSIPIPQDYV